MKRFKIPIETQEDIIQWANVAKQSCEDLDLDPQDVSLDHLLMIIEWNDAALQQRQVIKANIINYTNAVNNVAIQSDSIFSVMDTHTSPKGQIAEDIIDYLRQTYGPQPNASLGKCYIIRATKNDQFEITECRNVF
ncbi:hypothetical protein F8M41_021047 [Gigaspora margarita]|uniref:Uncharacterized protein n=1 Tax=Gigaspora margarita TaxID=4874 RepID=A0A8H4EJ92_GIGMA|nr:hypothetical protein F8M41_021047 [Gigaspora margarita]